MNEEVHEKKMKTSALLCSINSHSNQGGGVDFVLPLFWLSNFSIPVVTNGARYRRFLFTNVEILLRPKHQVLNI